jgi:hypothetical protein
MLSQHTRLITPSSVPEPLRLVGRYLSDTTHMESLPTLDTHELAWAAGFYDGEGSTFLAAAGGQGLRSPCCEVNQVRPEVLHRFHAAVGGIGSMRLRPDRLKRRPHPMWSWTTRNWRSTQTVLTMLWPYLDVVKRAQATTVFLEYQAQASASPKLGIARVRKLSDAQCVEIQARFAAGGVTKWALGKEYGVTDVMIGKIVRGERVNTNTALVWKGEAHGWST